MPFKPTKMKIKKLVTAVSAVLILSGCATIFSGTRAKVTVKDGNPASAKVFMNGNFIGNAPVTFKIPKKSFGKSSTIEIKADGYKPMTITIDKRVQAGFIILDLFTGVVELVVDFATGAIYKPDPGIVKYQLEKI